MAVTREGRHIHITGIVQGVGFRPFVYELATRYQLAGWVLNDSSGVEIEVAGPPEMLDAFIDSLQTEKPPLATIDSMRTESIALQSPIPALSQAEGTNLQSPAFKIRHSQSQADAFVPISPDISICDECLQELFDPADRRYRYPFINCTNCGPRFTIIRDVPYDRPMTTMVDFPMCPDCLREYEDPLNRRFHAQPNACPGCGPQVEFRVSPLPKGGGTKTSPLQGGTEGGLAIHLAQSVIVQGGIVAVKGLGGFHLACDATNDQVIQTLRQRKGRVDKPFAVMAPDIATVEQFAEVNPQEKALLISKERPIVLLKKKPDNPISEFVAPGNQYIGVMLPYTPLHYLLLSNEWPSDKFTSQQMTTGQGQTANDQSPNPNKPEPIEYVFQDFLLNVQEFHGLGTNLPIPQFKILVMTSGNYSEEPIVRDNAEALNRLAPLVDAFLLHNRNIHIHCDDSVIRVFEGRELPIRRSRGYAPFPVKLPFPVEETLAVGGELKNTFCLTKENYAFMSQHIGDMENLETLQAFETSVTHFQGLFRVKPKIIACDMHPGYLSTKWAEKTTNDKQRTTKREDSQAKIEVQHHHAHIAAVMVEHGLDGLKPVIGFSFDGTGYGTDGAIWGGELLLSDYQDFTRIAHLKYIPLPGGDAAIKRPYRTALAHLWAAGVEWAKMLPPVVACSKVERGIVKRQLETGLNSVSTSSMGRLFDAVASLAGMRQTVTYEAQAAIEFEAIMAGGVDERYEFELSMDSLPIEIDAGPVIRGVAADVQAGVPGAVISAKFHNAVANLVLRLSLWLREKEGINRIALSGGVFQNVTLLDLTVKQLNHKNFETLTHRLVPPNDGGLALGQAIISSQKSVNVIKLSTSQDSRPRKT